MSVVKRRSDIVGQTDGILSVTQQLGIPTGSTNPSTVPSDTDGGNSLALLFYNTTFGKAKIWYSGTWSDITNFADLTNAEVVAALTFTPENSANKGISNGYAGLDSSGKVPFSQLPANLLDYKGQWNSSTNTPTLVNGTGTTGDVWQASVAGIINFGAGNIDFLQGDFVIYNGSTWELSAGVDRVVSVNGYNGIVSLTSDAIPVGISNLYYTNALVETYGNTVYGQLGVINTWTYKQIFGAGSIVYSGQTFSFWNSARNAALQLQASSTTFGNCVITVPWTTGNLALMESLSATTPLFYNDTTGVFTIQQANTSQSGYLSNTDWNTFNGIFSQLPIHGNSTTTGLGTTVVTVTIGTTMGNLNYYVDISPQDALTAINWFVSAKTTTTFDITFLTAITGSINFDWVIIP